MSSKHAASRGLPRDPSSVLIRLLLRAVSVASLVSDHENFQTCFTVTRSKSSEPRPLLRLSYSLADSRLWKLGCQIWKGGNGQVDASIVAIRGLGTPPSPPHHDSSHVSFICSRVWYLISKATTGLGESAQSFLPVRYLSKMIRI
jgi:hypothetical protein